jgi:hypothetical protein
MSADCVGSTCQGERLEWRQIMDKTIDELRSEGRFPITVF